MADIFEVPDGLEELKVEMPIVVEWIARTTRWVHPDTFRAMPVWYPETARGLPMYDSAWAKVYTNTSRSTAKTTDKSEPNIKAGKAFVATLGTKRKPNWTVCHIWGVDDPKFQRANSIVRDRRYYSCVGNMVWLPTPLKGFTDAVPLIKRMMRTCAFHLYGWACEHPDVTSQAGEVRSGHIPDGYPSTWPMPGRHGLPPGTALYSQRVAIAIAKRKEELRRMLDNPMLTEFPRTEVREVLNFWKVAL